MNPQNGDWKRIIHGVNVGKDCGPRALPPSKRFSYEKSLEVIIYTNARALLIFGEHKPCPRYACNHESIVHCFWECPILVPSRNRIIRECLDTGWNIQYFYSFPALLDLTLKKDFKNVALLHTVYEWTWMTWKARNALVFAGRISRCCSRVCWDLT